MSSALRFDAEPGVAAEGVDEGPDDFDGRLLAPKEKPRENVSDRLKGIVANRGRRTGREAHI